MKSIKLELDVRGGRNLYRQRVALKVGTTWKVVKNVKGKEYADGWGTCSYILVQKVKQ